MLKGKVKGIYLRGDTYWFAKQVNGRRSFISLETGDYVAALQRAREILESPDLQPAQSFIAEVDRFLKHKYQTNRHSKMSADSMVVPKTATWPCERCRASGAVFSSRFERTSKPDET